MLYFFKAWALFKEKACSLSTDECNIITHDGKYPFANKNEKQSPKNFQFDCMGYANTPKIQEIAFWEKKKWIFTDKFKLKNLTVISRCKNYHDFRRHRIYLSTEPSQGCILRKAFFSVNLIHSFPWLQNITTDSWKTGK